MNRQRILAAVAGAAGMLLVLLLLGVVVVYAGAYNVAATDGHAPIARWAFDTTLHNSVADRAADVDAPPRFTAEMVVAGGGEYKAMCEHCHGGPGARPAEWARGMLPNPPHLREAATMWTPQQVFWIVQHGIKMSGMPAFGPTHDAARLWSIVAFVEQLPAMTAEEYAAIPSAHGHGGHGAATGETHHHEGDGH